MELRRRLADLAVTAMLFSALPALASAQTINVYLEPLPTDGFVDAESKRKADSLEDLSRYFSSDKMITRAEAAVQADVQLRLLSSQYEVTGVTVTTSQVTGGRLRSQTDRDSVPTLRVLLIAGTYQREFVGQSKLSVATWGLAAQSTALDVKAWIKDNREKLIAARK